MISDLDMDGISLNRTYRLQVLWLEDQSESMQLHLVATSNWEWGDLGQNHSIRSKAWREVSGKRIGVSFCFSLPPEVRNRNHILLLSKGVYL